MCENVTILKSVQLDFGLAELRSDNILTFFPNETIKTYHLNHLKEMLIVFNNITEGVPKPYYSDNTYLSGKFGNKEKEFMGEHFHEFATAFAMKEQSSLVRFTTNIFIHLNKPNIPIKMFNTKNEAINWLKTL